MSSPYSPARVGADAGVSDGLAPPPLRQRAASSAYTEGACDASSAADAAAGGGAMECSIYQNYSASEVFVQGLAGMVDQQDVEAMIRAQKKMLQRFEKTNEMLSNCNTLSSTRLERARRDFKAHTVMVLEMKKDLDSVLKRIAAVKQKIAAQNPDAFRASGGSSGPLPEEDDEYDEAIKEKRRQELQQEHTQRQHHQRQESSDSQKSPKPPPDPS